MSKVVSKIEHPLTVRYMYIENGHEMFGIVHSYRTIKVQNCNHTEEYHIAVMEPVVVLPIISKWFKLLKNISPRKLVPLNKVIQICVWLNFEDLDVSFISLIPNISNVACQLVM